MFAMKRSHTFRRTLWLGIPTVTALTALAFLGHAFHRSYLRASLFDAVDHGDARQVEGLLDRGADLHWIERGQDSTWRGFTPLARACRQGRTDVARLLLERGAEVNVVAPDGLSLVEAAIQFKQYGIVRLLIGRGADVSARFNKKGFTPLFLAAGLPAAEHEEIYRLLLLHGAVPTPVEAVANGDAEGLSRLLRRGADPNLVDHAGNTALYRAASRGRTDMVRSLLKAGADVNQPSLQGETPLIAAATTRNRTLVELLVRSGADVHAKSFPGDTALRRARQSGESSIAQLLQENGAVR